MSNYSIINLGERSNQFLKAALDKACSDSEFRATLLTHPVQALNSLTGLEVPTGLKIRFVENAGADMTIVLPDLKTADSGELSDAALDAVAGGDDGWIDIVPGCSVDERPPPDWGDPKTV